MQAVCCNLLATVLFIHALLGCCWHHALSGKCCLHRHAAHATRHGADGPTAGHATHAHCASHHRLASKSQHGPHPDRNAPQPQPHEDCPGACTFLSAAKTNVDCDFGMALSLFWTDALSAQDGIANSARLEAWDTDSAKPTLPLRLHLLNQILLI